MPTFSVFCKNPPTNRCHACGSAVPDDDELCPDCGYYVASYDLGQDPDLDEQVDEDVEISDALEGLSAEALTRARNLGELLQQSLPSDASVYGWWDRDCRNMCAAWINSRGWFATITRTGEGGDGMWGTDTAAVVKGAIGRMVGPFSSVRDLVLSARYDDYGKLGWLPAPEAGAIVWGLLRLLDEEDLQVVKQQVRTRSRHVVGRRRDPLARTTELP